MKIYWKLLKVQEGLKAPKVQKNTFGKYNYRSCEDIVEAVKPLLVEEKLLLTITDELVIIGERYYIKAQATITDIEDGLQHTVTGFAREEETKKGMDGSQITGASSSYARKYALNGLFAIDDSEDSDATNGKETTDEKKNENMMKETGQGKIDNYKVKTLLKLIEDTGSDREKIETFAKCKIEDMTYNKWGEIIATLEKRKVNA